MTAGIQRRVEQVMGMPISLALRGAHSSGARADEAWNAVRDSLHEADRIFSTYRADSVISRLDRGELRLEDCPDVVAEVFDLGEQARLDSDGAFDIRRPGPDGRMVLDPSGVVKGWAVQRASAALELLDGTDFCLSAGGDMVCRSRMPSSPGWRVGVEDPYDPGQVIAVIPLRNGAVATSALSHRGAHITDPRTGLTPTALASVTVIGQDLTTVDIEATAAFVLGHAGLAWLEARGGRAGLVVRADGSIQRFGGAA